MPRIVGRDDAVQLVARRGLHRERSALSLLLHRKPPPGFRRLDIREGEPGAVCRTTGGRAHAPAAPNASLDPYGHPAAAGTVRQDGRPGEEPERKGPRPPLRSSTRHVPPGVVYSTGGNFQGRIWNEGEAGEGVPKSLSRAIARSQRSSTSIPDSENSS